jgi:hypothetical protein
MLLLHVDLQRLLVLVMPIAFGAFERFCAVSGKHLAGGRLAGRGAGREERRGGGGGGDGSTGGQ